MLPLTIKRTGIITYPIRHIKMNAVTFTELRAQLKEIPDLFLINMSPSFKRSLFT